MTHPLGLSRQDSDFESVQQITYLAKALSACVAVARVRGLEALVLATEDVGCAREEANWWQMAEAKLQQTCGRAGAKNVPFCKVF